MTALYDSIAPATQANNDAAAPAAGKLAWPKRMREQVAAVLAVLEALEELGMVECEDGAYRLQG